MINVEHSAEDREYFNQIEIDEIAGYIGAFLVIMGTLVWGYGDLYAALL